MRSRRNLTITLLALAWPACVATAQPRRNMTPTILKGPAEWRFERMPIPPGFARDIKLTGFEEARFAPGMFDTSSPNYFTYVLVVSAEGAPDLDGAAIKDFLEKYYRGLSTGLGRRKGLSPDPAQMTADVTSAPDKDRWNARVTFFDTFNDGRKTILNVEARVVPRPAAKRTGLILLISPQPKDNAAWKNLRDIGAGIDFGSE